MLLCPTTSRRPRHPGGSLLGGTFIPWFYSNPPYPLTIGSYGYNSWLTESHDRVAGHAGIPVLFDCAGPWVWPTHYHDPPEYEGNLAVTGQRRNWIARVCLNRHNGDINMLFRDWSVRKVGPKENWTLRWHAEFDTSGPWTLAGGVQPEDWPQWMRGFKDY